MGEWTEICVMKHRPSLRERGRGLSWAAARVSIAVGEATPRKSYTLQYTDMPQDPKLEGH